MKIISLLLLTYLIITESNSLYFSLAGESLCIIIEQSSQLQVYFFYEAVGSAPQNVRIEFQSQSGKVNPPALSGASGHTKYIDHNMKVCMSTTDGGYKSISIDFYTQDIHHLTQLAKKTDLYQLHNKLISVGTRIKDVNRQQIFQQQRQSIHQRIIQQHQNQLKLLVFVKVSIIIFVAAAQIYLLKTMLSKSNNSYQPV